MTPRNRFRFAGLFLFCFATSCEKHRTVIEFSPDIPPPTFIGGATCSYGPTNLEKKFYDKLSEAERITIQNKPGELSDVNRAFKLEGHDHQYASWWGIVREIKHNSHGRGGMLLIENKYFNGITDCNFQTISINGGGDFEIDVTEIPDDLIPLVLVRAYGAVTREQSNRPLINADYVRVWHWNQFRFTDGGEDHSNPEWRKNAKLRPDENPYVVDDRRPYYHDHLAPTAEQSDILRSFHLKRTRIEFANIPLEPWGETAVYAPTEYEKQFYDKLTNEAQRTVNSKPGEPLHSDFTLRGHGGQFVSWFGIVREVAHEASKSSGSLLIENKYFQASKDEPPQTVSINGGGNFRAILTSFTEGLPLSLVRVYGTVVREDNGVPVVQARYIRVWRWGEFDFDDYGADNGDPRWKKNRSLQPNESIQQAQLSADYYLRRLGPTAEQAQRITEFFKQIDAMRKLDQELEPSRIEEIAVNPSPTPSP